MDGSATKDLTATGIAANDDSRPFYALRDVEGRTIMLDVRLRTGDRCAFPYAYLLEVRHDRSAGVVLRFSTATVEIRGRHLGELYEALVTQRVLWVEEGGRDVLPESSPFVSAIVVSEQAR